MQKDIVKTTHSQQHTEQKKWRAKKIFGSIILLIVILIFSVMLILHIYIKENGASVLRGKVVIANYNDESFAIRTQTDTYRDTRTTLDSLNHKFHSNIKIGDFVYVICKIDPLDIGPKNFDVYFVIKSFGE